MKKKLLSLLLALCMVLTLAPAALADEETGEEPPTTSAGPDADVRDTDFFTDQIHADVDWADMEVTPVDTEEFLAAIGEIKALISDSANAEKVEELFKAVAEKFMTIQSNIDLLHIKSVIDTTDEEISDLYDAAYHDYIYDIFDPFILLVKDILTSPCKDYFVEQEKLTQDDIDSYLEYEPMTDEEKEAAVAGSAISNKYWDTASGEGVTFTYNDVEYTFDSVSEAYAAGALTDDDYAAINTGLVDAVYDALGEVYMESMAITKSEVTLDEEYDNYADYLYYYDYNRDYTVEDIAAFTEAVREYVPALADDVYDLYGLDVQKDYDSYSAFFYYDFTSDEVLDLVKPYLGQMSDELMEAYDYMLDHHLYDIQASPVKSDQGFTTIISGYGAPFFFNSPMEFVLDFSTILHEFGHYNNFYWHPSGWNDGSSSIDVAEVHSQSLELLFTQYYGEIFGGAGDSFRDLVLFNMLSSAVLSGSLYGELEIYAYTTEDVTFDMICDKYAELYELYFGVPCTEPREWVSVHHLTIQPMYYISYATSAIGALYFYSEALNNGFDAATDEYLEFVSQSVYDPFLAQFENVCGIDPLDPEYVAEIVGSIYEDLDIMDTLYPVVFTDVPRDDPYYSSVTNLYRHGGIAGYGDGTARLDAPATRAMVAQVLYQLFGVKGHNDTPFVDVAGKWYEDAAGWTYTRNVLSGSLGQDGALSFKGDEPLTYEAMALVFSNMLKLFGVEYTVQGEYTYTDGDKISPWAKDAIDLMVEVGYYVTDEEGNIDPDEVISRGDMFYLADALFNIVNG